jgi:hypothetical protein
LLQLLTPIFGTQRQTVPAQAESEGSYVRHLLLSSTIVLAASTGLMAAEPPPLPGEFVIQTMVKETYLTAVGGGGRTTDVIHTDATQIGSWEGFRLPPDKYGWRNTIQTVDRHYLTAVGGGGNDAIHTNAPTANLWEYFWIWKCGDLGSGYQYTIHARSEPVFGVFAYGGGGRVATRAGVVVAGAIGRLTDYAQRPVPFNNNWQKFKLIQQSDGSYALQTSNGINYVTAIRGGGLSSGGRFYDNLVTDRTQVQAWERFRFVDQGDCTYAIQTVSGYYLGKRTAAPGTGLGVFSTDVDDIKNATKFRLVMSFSRRTR